MPFPVLLGAGSLTDVSPGLFFWTIITFCILLLLLWKTAWKPILSTIETREKGIRDALEAAEKQQRDAQKMIDEHQQALDTARKESAEMVRRTQGEVEKAREELLEKARKEAESLQASARKQIEEEKKKAIAEVKTVAVDLAIQAASKLIQTEMSEDKQKQLVQEYLASLPGPQARS